MSFEYTDPSDSDKDHVRFLIGDTVEKDAMLTDEEINFVVSQNASVYMAGSAAAEACAAKLAREVSNSLEGASIQLSDQYNHYRELSRMLRMEAQRKGDSGVVMTGNISSTGTERDPTFELGMHDYSGEDSASLSSPMGS